MAESSSQPLKRSRLALRFKEPASEESDGDDDMIQVAYEASSGGGQSSSEEEEEERASVTMTMSDVDVLDCPICFSPLTIPVYQCVNGHTTCSNCFPKLRDKCPSCAEKLGKIRCRAIERIIESAEIPCAYESHGCAFKLKYINKHLHEDQCSSAPFGCPLEHCNFRGLFRKISPHVRQKHGGSVVGFSFNSSFSISLKRPHENSCCVVLDEERDRKLLVLTCTNDCVKIWCVGSPSRYAYALMAKQGGNSHWFQSTTEKAAGVIHDPPAVSFLQIPGYFFGADSTVELKVCIWSKKDASDADICWFIRGPLKPLLNFGF